MKTNILVVCAHHHILQVILRLTNANENWEAVGTSNKEEALEAMRVANYDLLLIGSGLPEADEQALIYYVETSCPDTKVSVHYGGGSGLLSAEIYEALAK
jgi:DNA-binding NarL/FixJ family response regulator